MGSFTFFLPRRHPGTRYSLFPFVLSCSSLRRLPDGPVRPSLVASARTSGARFSSPLGREAEDAVRAEEIVGRESAGEKRGRAAGGQYVRRAGGVIPQGHGRVITEKNRPGMVGFSPPSARHFPWRCANARGRISSANRHASSASWARITAPNSSRLCRASAPRSRPSNCRAKAAMAPSSTASSQPIKMLAPGGVLRLGDQVEGRELGPGSNDRQSPRLRSARQ